MSYLPILTHVVVRTQILIRGQYTGVRSTNKSSSSALPALGAGYGLVVSESAYGLGDRGSNPAGGAALFQR